MPCQSRTSLVGADQIKSSVAFNRRVGKPPRGIAALSPAGEGMQPEIDALVERPAGICAYAATVGRSVIRMSGTGSCQAAATGAGKIFHARKYPVAEAAVDAEDFVMSESWLKSKLRHNVRRRIERITGRRATSCDAGS